jgi:hypothetical protein
MRKESPKKPKEGRPAEATEDRKGKTSSARVKDKKKDRKKAHKESKAGTSRQEAEKNAAGPAGHQEKPAAPDLLSNPEAKGMGLVTGHPEEEEPAARSRTTPRGECSGQKMPDS